MYLAESKTSAISCVPGVSLVCPWCVERLLHDYNDKSIKQGCFQLGNLDLDLKIRIFGFPIKHKIRKKDFATDFVQGNPCWVRISITKVRR